MATISMGKRRRFYSITTKSDRMTPLIRIVAWTAAAFLLFLQQNRIILLQHQEQQDEQLSTVTVSNKTAPETETTEHQMKKPRIYQWPDISTDDVQNLTRSWWKPTILSRPKDWWYVHSYNLYQEGLLYVKTPKAASSTMAGITLRIAHRHGKDIPQEEVQESSSSSDKKVSHERIPETTINPCNSRQYHGLSYDYIDRNHTQSFLFATIRDPAQRAISDVFYRRSNQQLEYNETQILETLQEGVFLLSHRLTHIKVQGYQLAYLTMREKEEDNHDVDDDDKDEEEPSIDVSQLSRETTKQHIADVLNEYDFLLLVERMDESLVVLQFLLDLDTDDLLHIYSKSAGNYAMLIVKETCHRIQPPIVSDTTMRYLSSSDWHNRHYGDYLLHAAINASLDRTIADIGPERFQKALATFRQRMVLAQERCQAHAYFPCSSSGENQLKLSEESCYNRDWGCGYPCLDRLSESNSH
ncbi:galactose-3-O-sulfotransferase [Nitzschia inconspicua]|uniref:Galactose-3-O-sulfotransferase n=1 Tax=Nitzschia inconspicua TaxID=303405 RepID=A0A9K3K5M0_9STRA|nr:galactose-3-O-sulfotransferase [Nitzschia inconspicua]KAG7372957.1 galactose-3-O-sulfotransferase [Nitzschia inconspicua]